MKKTFLYALIFTLTTASFAGGVFLGKASQQPTITQLQDQLTKQKQYEAMLQDEIVTNAQLCNAQ